MPDPVQQTWVGTIAEFARITGMGLRKQHLPPERTDHRQLEGLGEFLETPDIGRGPAAAAQDGQGAARAREQCPQLPDLLRRRMGLGDLVGQRVRYVDGFRQHVLGQGHHHGTGAAGGGDVERARDQLGNAPGVVDLDHPLGHGAEDGPVVQFLEAFAAPRVALDLADEQYHRRRVLARDVDAGRGVGGARAARHEADAGGARQFALCLRHHRGTAFLAADGDFHGHVEQGVEHGEVAFSGDAEDVPDAVQRELAGQDGAGGARLGRSGGGKGRCRHAHCGSLIALLLGQGQAGAKCR